MVLCKCDCGIEKLVDFFNLKKGASLSCGCLRNEASSLPPGEAARRFLFKQYLHSAKNRGYEWNIDRDSFDKMISSGCRYCGIPPIKFRKPPNSPTGVYYNGLDRLDNSKGYTLDNIYGCCHICNQGKHTMSEDEFLSWVKQIYDYRFLKIIPEYESPRPASYKHLKSKRTAEEVLAKLE